MHVVGGLPAIDGADVADVLRGRVMAERRRLSRPGDRRVRDDRERQSDDGMLAIGPLCGNLGAPLSSMVECQVRDVQALAFELSPSEGSVRLTLQLRGRATDQKGAHMHSGVINRCVLSEDPDWETLVSRQELGPDEDSL